MTLDALYRDYRKVRYGTGVDSFAQVGTMAGMANKWISVEKRLPEWGETVIVCYEANFDAGREVTADTCYGDGVWTKADQMKGGQPTHWMPLPEPPTG